MRFSQDLPRTNPGLATIDSAQTAHNENRAGAHYELTAHPLEPSERGGPALSDLIMLQPFILIDGTATAVRYSTTVE